MSKGVKITLIVIGVLAVGGLSFYFINRMVKRKKAYKTSVTPELATEVINTVNANKI